MQAPPAGRPAPPADEPRVPAAAIVAFLVRFSVALHKHSTYPPGHPTLQAADAAVAQALAPLFESRTELRVGVARQSLVIDDEPTEGHPVLRELAERLHRRSVGGLLLRRGLTPAELSEVLSHLSGDAQVLRARLLGEGEPLPEWPHAEVVAHAFRRLALAGEGDVSATEGAQRLWLELANSAFSTGDPADSSADAVATFGRYICTLKNTGKRVDSPVAHLFKFRDGKIVWTKGFTDRAEALKAAGLSE